MRVAVRIFDTHPERVGAVLRVLAETLPLGDLDAPGRMERVRETLAAARAQVPALDRPRREVEELTSFARAHPSTTAGAKALFLAGFRLANDLHARETDPTGRLLRVLDLVARLEGGRSPRCEWTERAPDLVVNFYARSPGYSRRNAVRVLAAYLSFAVRHWKLDPWYPADSGIGYLVTRKMTELCRIEGDALQGMERVFAELDARVADRSAVQYLRALFYVHAAQSGAPASRSALLHKARQALTSIHARAQDLYRRKSLATLASLAFFHRDYPTARRAFAEYVHAFPESPYAWVAALRVGQCLERMDDWPGALAAYGAVPGAGIHAPVARVLAAVFAGRAHEAVGDPVAALARFREAVGLWDPAFGQTYHVRANQASLPGEPLRLGGDPDFQATKADVEDRIAQLERTTSAPGSVLLERARWLLRMKRWKEAAEAAARVAVECPASPNLPEARYLGQRAELEDAFERADAEKPGRDIRSALAILDRLSREPFDFAVCVAAIARAYLASGGGSSPEGERLLLEAVTRWHERQASEVPSRPLTALEQDVADIRSLVFHPSGDAIFSGSCWNGFAWPSRPAPFVVLAPEVAVLLADGHVTRLSFGQRIAHLDNVIFLDREQLALLDSLMTHVGGTKTREGVISIAEGLMEPPTRPVGPSLDAMTFLDKAFHVMPDHSGGWHFVTFPRILELRFVDDARTRALARVRVGYGGGNVLLEKRDGTRVATKLEQTWVE